MGLSYDDAKRLGIGHLHPAEAGEITPRSGGLVLPPHGPTKPDDGMNKTERAFGETLRDAWMKDLIQSYWFAPVKVRLAGRTWYAPDFLVHTRDGDFIFIEVKGFMRDDAAVKLKVAADYYPCFGWLLVTRAGRHGWRVHVVNRSGIAKTPIEIPWIHH